MKDTKSMFVRGQILAKHQTRKTLNAKNKLQTNINKTKNIYTIKQSRQLWISDAIMGGIRQKY